MNAAALAFRFRVLIFVTLYVLGFFAPSLFGAGSGTLWLAASSLRAHSGWIGLAPATLVVTLLALGSLSLGAILRVWGTAYLGSATMSGAGLRGGSVVAGGPYGYVRNPLYLGSWLIALGTSVLMPTTGALFFLPALTAFLLILIFAEERFLGATQGAAYEQYRRQVPRLFPRLSPQAGAAAMRPRWFEAVVVESHPTGFALCFAIFAWRYNAHILMRCLLVCYGVSLVARALTKSQAPHPGA